MQWGAAPETRGDQFAPLVNVHIMPIDGVTLSHPVNNTGNTYMRIIGNIEHPSLKITVFKMEGRTSVKFENAQYEQTYKLGEDDRFSDLENISKLIDQAFIADVLNGMKQMHQTRLSAVSRAYPATETEEFEEII